MELSVFDPGGRTSSTRTTAPRPGAGAGSGCPTRPPWSLEEPTAMLHFSCDICGKNLTPDGASRYVVKMEAFAATDPAELTETDLDSDHVEEMAQLLNEMEETGCEVGPAVLPATKKMRFDLCPCCYRKFLADPLGRENAAKFDFSEN
jgi:hypothetical protein